MKHLHTLISLGDYNRSDENNIYVLLSVANKACGHKAHSLILELNQDTLSLRRMASKDVQRIRNDLRMALRL